jgi:hypothetical protein
MPSAEYNRKMMERCKMDCFNCTLPDCRNNAPPTEKEKTMLKDAFGLNDPIYLKRKELEEREWHKIYSKLYYAKKKGKVLKGV